MNEIGIFFYLLGKIVNTSWASKQVTISKAALPALHLEVGEAGIALGW